MLAFAGRSEADTLFGRLVSLWLVGWHDFYSDEGLEFKEPEFNGSCRLFQGRKVRKRRNCEEVG